MDLKRGAKRPPRYNLGPDGLPYEFLDLICVLRLQQSLLLSLFTIVLSYAVFQTQELDLSLDNMRC